MIRKCTLILLIILLSAGGCKNINSRQITDETEKLTVAYTFVLNKLKEDNLSLIASDNDENLELLNNIIESSKLNFEVENYANIERGPDLCYYSKSTKQQVAVIGVAKRNEKNYYVSYYIGPEGGASKDIHIEKRSGKWTVINDDGFWDVK